VLVTLGGADPDNRTLKVIQALAPLRSPDLDVVVIVGGSNPHRATLEEGTRAAHGSLRLLHPVTDMAALMAERDIAISAAGSTTWEIAFMGLPALLGAIVEGEEQSLSHVVKTGLCMGLGNFASVPPATLAERFLALF